MDALGQYPAELDVSIDQYDVLETGPCALERGRQAGGTRSYYHEVRRDGRLHGRSSGALFVWPENSREPSPSLVTSVTGILSSRASIPATL